MGTGTGIKERDAGIWEQIDGSREDTQEHGTGAGIWEQVQGSREEIQEHGNK